MTKKKTLDFAAVDALISSAQAPRSALLGPVTVNELKAQHEELHVAVEYMTNKKAGGHRLSALKQCKECIKRKWLDLESKQSRQLQPEAIAA